MAPLVARDFELLVWSAGLTGHDDELIRAGERSYHANLDAGDCLRAARWAFCTGFRLFGMGEPST